MKFLILSLSIMLSISVNSQVWIEDSNCNSKSSDMVNEAINYMTNIEPLVALGLAKAAIMVDKKCECAKLVIAAISSPNPNWGTRKNKLEKINQDKLSAEENGWYELLVSTTTEDQDWDSTYEKVLENFPDSPLFNWFGTSRQDWSTYSKYADRFPNFAAGAYNMLAYANAYGEVGEGPDFDAAYALLEKLETLHDGPNSYDSRAEIAAMDGDYQTALSNQLKAVDYASFASPYWEKAPTYWRSLNKDDVSAGLIEAQKKMQNAILERDLDEFKNYVSDDMPLVSGDSNLGDFYTFNESNLEEETAFTWNSFDMRDFETHFSSDMKTVVLTFYTSGSYTFTESQKEVAYSTRASSVWIATDDGWICTHTNWAPYKSGVGIPN